MSQDPQQFIENTVAEYRPLYIAYTHAVWEAATAGTEGANRAEKEAHAALLHFWADRERFDLVKTYRQDETLENPTQRRQIDLIYLSAAEAQQDETTIEALTRLEADVRKAYYNFRGMVGGEALSDNELEKVLKESDNSAEAQEAWEASKQIGAEVADSIRELAQVRNRAAQSQGFRDHFQKSLQLSEIDENELLSLFEELDRVSLEPFRNLKAEIDEKRARHFGISIGELQPWHFGDRFFQSAPKLDESDIERYFEDQDPKDLATATYDGLGLEVRDILLRSDLYARPGKNQHAFCIDMDHEGDVRTLNNLEPNMKWTSTLLHELGHAIYDKYIDRQLPWLLRTPAHILSTEAIAILMGSLINDRSWLIEVLSVPTEIADTISAAGRKRQYADGLIFTRWCLVMTHFEKSLYADPNQDLDTLWWDLVERYQLLRRPKDRVAPDWAAKYHVALVPVYYQNYELGLLTSLQWRSFMESDVGNMVGTQAAGQWLVHRVFRSGALHDWKKHIEVVTGERLSPKYFIRSLNISV
jgi:peptidyl-dipeptidase A